MKDIFTPVVRSVRSFVLFSLSPEAERLASSSATANNPLSPRDTLGRSLFHTNMLQTVRQMRGMDGRAYCTGC